ncbi:hypothetical protein AAZX31_02G166000 [Glycine max]
MKFVTLISAFSSHFLAHLKLFEKLNNCTFLTCSCHDLSLITPFRTTCVSIQMEKGKHRRWQFCGGFKELLLYKPHHHTTTPPVKPVQHV